MNFTRQISPHLVMGLLVLCYAMWGGGMTAMKFAYESFGGCQIVFARVAFAAVFYLIIWRRWAIPYQKGDWRWICLLVAFEPCLFFIFETFSMKYTTASQGGVIAACFPICTAIAAWIFLGEKLSARIIGAIALAVAGVAMSSCFASDDARASNPLLGNLLMFGAVLSSSGYAVCVRYISRRYSFLAISAIQAIGGGIVFLPLLFFEPIPTNVSFSALGGLLYMGLVVGLLVYLSFNFSLQHLEAGIVALFGNLIPVFTVIIAWLILSENISLLQLTGICLTLLGGHHRQYGHQITKVLPFFFGYFRIKQCGLLPSNRQDSTQRFISKRHDQICSVRL